MNLELSLNIAASIEGWFSDYWSWKWIFWDTALLAPLMMVCIHFGMPHQPVKRELLKTADWPGILYASTGFSLIYAALDQGNRLDWLNSGLINALLLGGGLLLVAFVVHELTHDRPWVNLSFVIRGNFPLILLFITFFRFAILSTSYIIPQYLTTVQNYRAMEIGGVLIWIALPQFVLAPIVATILRFVDARVPMAFGFALVGAACFMAGELTHDWAGDDFLPSQIVQAVGQSFGLNVAGLVQFEPPAAERDSHLRRDAADGAPVRGATRRGLRANIHPDARADLLEPHRAPRHHGVAADRSAAAGLCARRNGTLRRRGRSECARHSAPCPRRAGPSVCARLYRWLHVPRLRDDRRFAADGVSAHPDRSAELTGTRRGRAGVKRNQRCR